jgi:hypothetical protein
MNRRNIFIACLTILGVLSATLSEWAIAFSAKKGGSDRGWPDDVHRSYDVQTGVWITACFVAVAMLASLWLRRDSRVLAVGLILMAVTNLSAAWLYILTVDSHDTEHPVPVRTWILLGTGPVLWFFAGILGLKNPEEEEQREVLLTEQQGGATEHEEHPFWNLAGLLGLQKPQASATMDHEEGETDEGHPFILHEEDEEAGASPESQGVVSGNVVAAE